jgi:hydrogenase maturation protease
VKVIGVGNAWRRDDAAGLEAAHRLGGTAVEGDVADLVEALAGQDEVVIVDAVSGGAAPGTVTVLAPPLPPELFAASTHVLGLADALELARALGKLPPRVLVYGIEGADFGTGEGLTDAVAAAVARVVEEVAARAGAR